MFFGSRLKYSAVRKKLLVLECDTQRFMLCDHLKSYRMQHQLIANKPLTFARAFSALTPLLSALATLGLSRWIKNSDSSNETAKRASFWQVLGTFFSWYGDQQSRRNAPGR